MADADLTAQATVDANYKAQLAEHVDRLVADAGPELAAELAEKIFDRTPQRARLALDNADPVAIANLVVHYLYRPLGSS